MSNPLRPIIIYSILNALLLLGALVCAEKRPNTLVGGCALISTKIYCYGGSTSALVQNILDGPTNALHSLDISSTITRDDNSSSWEPIITPTRPPSNAFFGMASAPGGDYFVVAGGVNGTRSDITTDYYWVYNATANDWTTIQSQKRLKYMSSAVYDKKNNTNSFFIYGGYIQVPPSGKVVFSEQPYFFSYSSTGSSEHTGTAMVVNITTLHPFRAYAATFQGSDGKFYITGGNYATVLNGTVTDYFRIDMGFLLIYDMVSGWSFARITNAGPDGRFYHSMTLLNDGSVLLYGGRSHIYNASTSFPAPDFAYVMDTTKLLWTNKTQEIVDRSGGHAAADEMQFARYGHSAVLVGDHVFILFGVGTYTVLADSFLILDTTTWTMTNSFPGLGSTDGGCSPDASRCEIDARRLGAGAIAGIAVGCAAAVAIMLLTLFCLYRRRKHKKPGDAALSDDMKTKTTDGPLDFGQEKLNSCTADTEFSVHAAVNSTQPLRLSPIKPDGLTDSPGHMDGTTVHLLTQKPDGN